MFVVPFKIFNAFCNAIQYEAILNLIEVDRKTCFLFADNYFERIRLDR